MDHRLTGICHIWFSVYFYLVLSSSQQLCRMTAEGKGGRSETSVASGMDECYIRSEMDYVVFNLIRVTTHHVISHLCHVIPYYVM